MTTTSVQLNKNPNPFCKDRVSIVRRLNINDAVMSTVYMATINQVVAYTMGALTSVYGNDLSGQLNKLIQKYHFTPEQDKILRTITSKLIEIEKEHKLSFNLNMGHATDDEITISRTSSHGLGLLVVDPFGNILVHFAGYKEGKKMNFYTYQNYDAEAVVYDFLHS